MAVTIAVGSPAWWVEKLNDRRKSQLVEISRYERYFDGQQALPVALSTKEYRKEFDAMLREVRDNWMPLVVEASSERLNVIGFRFAGTSETEADGAEDAKADAASSAIWQRNFLDADSKLAHQTALITGRCPIMVWAGADKKAEITVEHPGQVVVAYTAGSRRQRAAALKAWQDEWTNKWFFNLYLPDAIYKFTGDENGASIKELADAKVANPLKVVPVVEIRNRLRLSDGQPRSELMEVTSTQDQINKTTIDMLVAAEFAAFRQRWATGVEIPKDENGVEIETLKTAVDRMWTVGDDKARFGDFQATELKQYVELIESRILSIARRTRTPPHYMLGGSGTMPSGESIKAAETGLVAKVKDRQVTFGETWEEAMRLAALVEGDTERGVAFSAETIWADPESRTESEHVDAVTKKKALRVPTMQLWEDLGYTPTQISRFKGMLLEEAMLQMLAEPPESIGKPSPIPEPAPV